MSFTHSFASSRIKSSDSTAENLLALRTDLDMDLQKSSAEEEAAEKLIVANYKAYETTVASKQVHRAMLISMIGEIHRYRTQMITQSLNEKLQQQNNIDCLNISRKKSPSSGSGLHAVRQLSPKSSEKLLDKILQAEAEAFEEVASLETYLKEDLRTVKESYAKAGLTQPDHYPALVQKLRHYF